MSATVSAGSSLQGDGSRSLEAKPEFRSFIERLTGSVDAWSRTARTPRDEADLVRDAGSAAAKLVAADDWLPPAAATPHADRYQQYLLYCDPDERFSVVSFVWGPRQYTPIHDHTTWGVIAMLRGAERSDSYALGAPMRKTGSVMLRAGDIDIVSPATGDIHQVANALDDQVSIGIHIYGGNIGRIVRHVFAAETGKRKNFVSGYANADEHVRGYAFLRD